MYKESVAAPNPHSCSIADSLYMIPPHTKAISKHSALSGEAASTGEGAVRFFCVNIPEMGALQG